jgi:CRP/FNR family transcriptional regulator, cyclic AMP receptor protein
MNSDKVLSGGGILGAFAGHAFLRGLSQRDLLALASVARPFTTAAGQYVAREGETAHAFYLVQSGHLALETRSPEGGQVSVQTVGPGEVVGWSWLVPPYRWQFDCRALDRAQGLVLDGEWLRERCELDHEFGYHLLKHLVVVIGNRLAAARRQGVGLPR